MSAYLYGQAVDRQAAQRARVPPGVRPLPLLRPHREGGGGPFRDRREKRFLFPGVAGAEGVHPPPPEIPPQDRVPRGGGASFPLARPGAGTGARREPPGGDRARRGGGGRGPRGGGGGPGKGDPPPKRRNPSRARQPRLCPRRRSERVPVLPDRGESRRRFPQTVGTQEAAMTGRPPHTAAVSTAD